MRMDACVDWAALVYIYIVLNKANAMCTRYVTNDCDYRLCGSQSGQRSHYLRCHSVDENSKPPDKRPSHSSGVGRTAAFLLLAGFRLSA